MSTNSSLLLWSDFEFALYVSFASDLGRMGDDGLLLFIRADRTTQRDRSIARNDLYVMGIDGQRFIFDDGPADLARGFDISLVVLLIVRSRSISVAIALVSGSVVGLRLSVLGKQPPGTEPNSKIAVAAMAAPDLRFSINIFLGSPPQLVIGRRAVHPSSTTAADYRPSLLNGWRRGILVTCAE